MASRLHVDRAMRQRSGSLLVLFGLFATSAAAQHTYIVPVDGTASGFQSQFFTSVVAVNPSGATATLRYDAAYPAAGTTNCQLPASLTVRARQLAGLAPACFGLHALVVTSDQPLKLIAEVNAWFIARDATGNSFGRPEMEPVEVATEWLEPDRDVMVPLIRMLDPPDKANLVLVNPNDFFLSVSVHIDRPELKQSADATIEVPPRSFRMSGLAQIPNPPPNGFPQGVDAVHNVTMRANGKFQAGVSNTFEGMTIYRAAIPLSP